MMMNLKKDDKKDNAASPNNDVPRFVITPVSTLLKRMKTAEQSTLTQMFSIADEDLSTDDPYFISHEKRKRTMLKIKYTMLQ